MVNSSKLKQLGSKKTSRMFSKKRWL